MEVILKECSVKLSRCDNECHLTNHDTDCNPTKRKFSKDSECTLNDLAISENEEHVFADERRPKRECSGKVNLKEDSDEDLLQQENIKYNNSNKKKTTKHRTSKPCKTSSSSSETKQTTTSTAVVSSTTNVDAEVSASKPEAQKRGCAKKISDSHSDALSKPLNDTIVSTISHNQSRSSGIKMFSGVDTTTNEITLEQLSTIVLANNMNFRRNLELQTLFVKIDDAADGMNALLGWAVKSESKLFFQCMFCPLVDTSAKGISMHVRTAHQKLSFAMIKKVPQSGLMLFMHCRRCDFISVDITSIWIHFSIHHGLQRILSDPNVTDVTPPPTVRQSINAADVAVIFPFFKCTMCSFLATDNRYVAQHAVHSHPSGDVTTQYNGCFVQVIKLSKPKQLIPGETYSDVVEKFEGVTGAASVGMQTNIFVCVFCSYVSYIRLLAISHHIRLHTGKHLMYKCSYDQCRERSMSSESMIQHLKTVHECGTMLCQRMCCQVTLIERQEHELVEAFSF